VLTPERIIWQAATVADEVGLDRLTLRRRAALLVSRCRACTSTSAGWTRSGAAIALVGVRELADDVGAGRGWAWPAPDALRAISAAYRSYALA